MIARPDLPKPYKPVQFLPDGIVHRVATSQQLQSALDIARGGDTIEIAAGEYDGNFRADGTDGVVLVRPAVGDERSVKLVSPNTDPTLRISPGIGGSSQGWIFRDLEITTQHDHTNVTQYGIVECGWQNGHPRTIDDLPKNIVFQRCRIHGTETGNIRRCVLFDVINGALLDCSLTDAHEVGADSQALWTLNGQRVLVDNCTLEGSGQCFMSGGDDSMIPGHHPSDWTFIDCLFRKPSEWRDLPWTEKNSWEIKSGERFLVQDCTMDGSWTDGQDGHAILITPRNQYGRRPDTRAQHITLRNIDIVNCERGIDIINSDNNAPTLPVENVLIEQVRAEGLERSMFLLLNTNDGKPAKNIAIRNCSWTFKHDAESNFFMVGDRYSNNPFCIGFEFSGNSGPAGEWGLYTGNSSSMNDYFQDWAWTDNDINPSHPSVPDDTDGSTPTPTVPVEFTWTLDARTVSTRLGVNGTVEVVGHGVEEYTIDLPEGRHSWMLVCKSESGESIEVEGPDVLVTIDEPFFGATNLRAEVK